MINEVAATGISHYAGTYSSTLEQDDEGYPWWEKDDYAIWWKDSKWRVGLLTDKGSAGVLLKTLGDSNCPHSDQLNGQDEVKWQFRVDEKQVWEEAEHFGIFTTYGEFHHE